mmetsp:Transcript_63274/g.100623  ORF Transcript_63274/g.100623 Transcript_63274/m.100623 type:complete len:666 (-) Transcript_63274:657-2654(-)|eukprot:CAMPEP_0197079916 /NCGR_PEP_ID=MMETSP1384-20130603/213863_1 /TAXON_ID=29189 /ORGANISM="Ammonia sp." /LENGTH=665 /DNA_ID=CAMNT_0042518797 /DNA_START=83 /DNA_END=2080 /DNA_ORIENTATION=-
MSGKETSLQIYARVRSLMPWEPKKVSLKVVGKTVQNKSGKVVNEYDFRQVFKPNSTNEQCFQTIALPMIQNVLKGFNAVLIAYGQTGSGKTYSMLGKPKLNIVGILPMTLQHIVKQPNVSKLELSGVEAFGHHVAKIYLFDLFRPDNQVRQWDLKKGETTIDPKKAIRVEIADANDAHDKIIYAHAASHFAPTGKNPESSRGHVTFIATVHQTGASAHELNTSYFVMVDCAGSEGETAFTPEFRKMVTPQVLLCRRLEAGTINTGLSQLQVICNELRKHGKLQNTVGNGLRRVLHPFIDTKTFLSVLFALSPSVNNSKPTESTLKFAVTAGMVKVKPVMTKGKVNFKTLAAELRAHIEKQEQVIDENNRQIENVMRMQNKLKFEIEQKAKNPGGPAGQEEEKLQEMGIAKETRTKTVINDDGDEEEVLEEYYVDVDGNEVQKPVIEISANMGGDDGGYTPATPAAIDDETSDAVQQVLSGLDDTQTEFMKGLGSEFLEEMANESLSSNKSGAHGRGRTVTAEENDEALKLAMEQYAKLTIPWKKEQLLVKTKRDLAKKKKAKEQAKKKEEEEAKIKEIEEQIRKSQEEFNKIKAKQAEVTAKLADPNYKPEKEELSEHAMTLSIMLAEQKSMTQALQQSKEVMIDFLQSDGREALVAFFKIRKGV